MTRAAVVGLFVALSSTAVVLKELARKNQLHSPHGRLTIGVLLLQDIVVIAVLASAPALLGGEPAIHGGSVWRRAADSRRSSAAACCCSVAFCCRGCCRSRRRSRVKRSALSVLLASVGTAYLAALLGLVDGGRRVSRGPDPRRRRVQSSGPRRCAAAARSARQPVLHLYRHAARRARRCCPCCRWSLAVAVGDHRWRRRRWPRRALR